MNYPTSHLQDVDVGFEVLRAMVMKSSIFWDITPCSSLKVNLCFGGKFRLHLQGRGISQAGFTLLATYFTLVSCLAYFFDPKSRLAFNGLHDIISQKIELYKSICYFRSNYSYANIYCFKSDTSRNFIREHFHAGVCSAGG
jgi:hypothetical protein